jgi:hypothetical protein
VKQRFVSVLSFKRVDSAVAILPHAIKRCKTTSYTGKWCERCAVLPGEKWRTRGLDVVLDLLKGAPYQADVSLDPLPNRPSSEVFGTDQLVVYARAVCWVTREDDSAPKLGRVEIYPSWTPFESRDVFRFMKPPSREGFVAEMDRLLAT